MSEDVVAQHAATRAKNMAAKLSAGGYSAATSSKPTASISSQRESAADINLEDYEDDDLIDPAPVALKPGKSVSNYIGSDMASKQDVAASHHPAATAVAYPSVPPTTLQPASAVVPQTAPISLPSAPAVPVTLNLNFAGLFQGLPAAFAYPHMAHGGVYPGQSMLPTGHGGLLGAAGSNYSAGFGGGYPIAAGDAAIISGYNNAGMPSSTNMMSAYGGGYAGTSGALPMAGPQVIQTGVVRDRSAESPNVGGRLRRGDGQYVKQCRGTSGRRFVICDDDD